MARSMKGDKIVQAKGDDLKVLKVMLWLDYVVFETTNAELLLDSPLYAIHPQLVSVMTFWKQPKLIAYLVA